MIKRRYQIIAQNPLTGCYEPISQNFTLAEARRKLEALQALIHKNENGAALTYIDPKIIKNHARQTLIQF